MHRAVNSQDGLQLLGVLPLSQRLPLCEKQAGASAELGCLLLGFTFLRSFSFRLWRLSRLLEALTGSICTLILLARILFVLVYKTVSMLSGHYRLLQVCHGDTYGHSFLNSVNSDVYNVTPLLTHLWPKE